MPKIKFKVFDQRVKDKDYDKLLIKGVHEYFYLYLIQGEETYIYCRENDQYKVYCHAKQILTWLKRNYGIYRIEINIEAWSWHG
jgi:hypothetical protein